MEHYKKPIVLSIITASALAMVGAALGWFTIENQLVRELAESELGNKQNISIAISFVCAGLTLLAAKTNKQRLTFIGTALGLYGLILIINQKPDAAIAEQIGLLVKPGYWMSIGGTLVMLIANAIIGIKGFDLFKTK